MRIFGEDLIADGILILSFLIHGPMHLDELTGFQRPASDRTPLELLDKRHDVDDIEHVSLNSADCIFEGRQR